MTILVEKIAKNILKILINRPNKRNALDLNSFRLFKRALEQFEADNEIKIAVIGGVEGNFCAGYDLNEIIQYETGLPNINQIENMLLPLGSRLSNKKLTIAAIEGHAAGFGYELALKCDFRIADRDSRMGFMNRRFGIPIMNGGTVILPQLISHARACDLIATGKAQLANEALNYGILNYVSDIGCAQGRALNFARSLAKFDQETLLLDLKGYLNTEEISNDQTITMEALRLERVRALDYLKRCGPRDCAIKFLNGQLCRHGTYDLGNSSKPEADVSL